MLLAKELRVRTERRSISGTPAVLVARTGTPKHVSCSNQPSAWCEIIPRQPPAFTHGGHRKIAAIYARKSTDQTGVAEEQKSVTRQVEHARQYAARKGGLSAASTCTPMTESAV
jgi:hypothetical protein